MEINKNLQPVQEINPKYTSVESGEGTYAFDVIGLGKAPSLKDVHDGNLGFHSVNTLHDEGFGLIDDMNGKRNLDVISQWGSQGTEINVVPDQYVFGNSLATPDNNTAADQWMEENGQSW